MNTQRSDQLVEKWFNKDNRLRRNGISFEKTFQTSPEKLFPLLCPTTEYDWLPGWASELLHSKSGYTEQNAVFRTNFFGPEEIWVCTHFEPNKSIEYTRFSQDITATMAISLTDNYDGTVTGRWVITASALNENGNAIVNSFQASGRHMEEILSSLDYYVTHGQMVS